MILKKPAMAGTLESSDVQITLRPNPNGGVQLNLRSDVMAQFGDAIRDTVLEELKKFDLNDVVVDVEDKGALDFVIRSRLQCAICRGAEISYNWAEEDGHGKQWTDAYLPVRRRHQPREDDPGWLL